VEKETAIGFNLSVYAIMHEFQQTLSDAANGLGKSDEIIHE